MHSLFTQVLSKKNLSKAGDLFSLEDQYIINDLDEVLATIHEIISTTDFLTSYNDQSLVEICITRLTSAIRETGSIEAAAKPMVALLETCLSYNLRPTGKGPDPPHAKIASDIMSCIFLNYSKKNVMQLALPVSVKFLHKGNKDLSRNMSSYLSLAAIENAELLAQHIQPIIDSVISGNYSLARVLPQIYSVNPDPIKNHVMTLVSILPNCDNTEKLALLSLFGLIAKNNSAVPLLEPSIPQLCECLTSQATAAATLQVFWNISQTQTNPLADHLTQYKMTAENFPKTTLLAIQVMVAIAKTKQDKAQETLDFILSVVGRLESEKHSYVLKEILALTSRYPKLLTANLINKVSSLEDGGSPGTKIQIQELRNEYNNSKSIEKLNSIKGGVTVVTVGGGGSRTELYRLSSALTTIASPTPTSLSITSTRPSDISLFTPASKSVRSKVESRSTGRLPTHRSMTKLNVNAPAGAFDSRLGLHKSMTRLNTSQQSMPRYPSSQAVPTTVARSVTCIKGAGTPTAGTPTSAVTARVTVNTGPGAASPTKSMSSGSMSGLTDGREVLTVNVNQINQDLIRQASNVLSAHDINALPPVPTSSYTHIPSIPPSTAHASSNALPSYHSTAPFSLPTHSSRRVPPYSSGPLPTSQPPSLGLPVPMTTASTSAAVVTTSVTSVVPMRPHNVLSNTLPSPRRRQQNRLNGITSKEEGEKPSQHNRMSVFEPYPLRDTVQHFCEKHLDKIKLYMESLGVKLPLPIKCTIEERKGKKHAKLHFACQGRTGEHCLYKTTFYTMKTRNPKPWIHLMFLALQARSPSAISTRETSVSALKNCWEILKADTISFVTLVTGAFPPSKDQDALLHELRSHRFFDVFEYNGPLKIWGCFLCNHPDRAMEFIQDEEPVIEGQLKEKKGGRWKIFKKWKSRYFTLSGARLSYKETTSGDMNGMTQSLDVGSIRSVKVSKEGRRNIPKAFEIFTHDRTFVLKAKDGSNAQEWVQCLSVAKAHVQARDSNLKKLAYGGSLGRLNHHGRSALHFNRHTSTLNSNMALRTAV